ncbi:MAG: hypothetical protein NTW25_00290 [Candidatus Kapabacteria bacterium]|nr:hypothetical protein [Candidatus Kapabacteria bacterium]
MSFFDIVFSYFSKKMTTNPYSNFNCDELKLLKEKHEELISINLERRNSTGPDISTEVNLPQLYKELKLINETILNKGC